MLVHHVCVDWFVEQDCQLLFFITSLSPYESITQTSQNQHLYCKLQNTAVYIICHFIFLIASSRMVSAEEAVNYHNQLASWYSFQDDVHSNNSHTCPLGSSPPHCPSRAFNKPLAPILDLRPVPDFRQRRLLGSCNIPLDQLLKRMFLLPDKGQSLFLVLPNQPSPTVASVVLSDASQELQAEHQPAVRACVFPLKGDSSIYNFFQNSGWPVLGGLQDHEDVWQTAAVLGVLESSELEVSSLQKRWLFQPSPLLFQEIDLVETSLFGTRLHDHGQGGRVYTGSSALPALCGRTVTLRALDVGCGSGRDLAWLASRKTKKELPGSSVLDKDKSCEQACMQLYDPLATPLAGSPDLCVQVKWNVTGLDNWEGAIQRAQDLLQLAGFPESCACCCLAAIDTATGNIQAKIPNKPWPTATHIKLVQQVELQNFDLVLCVRFLERSFLPCIKQLLAPGGFVLYSTFLDLPGVRKFGRPSNDHHLLQVGELGSKYFGPGHGFEIVRDDVYVNSDGREICMFVARKL